MTEKRKLNKADELASQEQAVTDSYMRLIEAVLLNALERLQISHEWKTAKITPRMIKRKQKDVERIGKWMKSEGAKVWYHFYEIATETSADRIKRRFETVERASKKWVKKMLKTLEP